MHTRILVAGRPEMVFSFVDDRHDDDDDDGDDGFLSLFIFQISAANPARNYMWIDHPNTIWVERSIPAQKPGTVYKVHIVWCIHEAGSANKYC